MNECCHLGRPAIYIPLPGASGDEQTVNARMVEKAGGAVVLPQATLTGAGLLGAVVSLFADRAMLAAMGERARTSPSRTPPSASPGSSRGRRPRGSAPAERPARVITGLILLQAALSIAVAGPATDLEYLPLRVAAAEGYFAEEKLSVTLETVRAEPLAAQALGRGRVALAATSLDAALSVGHAGSAPPRLVFGLTAAPPVALLVPAAKKDPVKALADLTGKTIGISAPGTPGALALSSLLAREGIGVHQVTIQSFGERALIGALDSGAIEAAIRAGPLGVSNSSTRARRWPSWTSARPPRRRAGSAGRRCMPRFSSLPIARSDGRS